jgi:hypothetical protein
MHCLPVRKAAFRAQLSIIRILHQIDQGTDGPMDMRLIIINRVIAR